MNRLALAVALAVLPMTGGCMFFTPPTGVCVGESCKTFEKARDEVAAAVAAQANQPPAPQPLQYRTTDFELVFPGIWGELSITTKDEAGKETTSPLRDQTEASGVSTLRIAVGGLIPTEEGQAASEGIRVITLNTGLDTADTAKAEAALADITRRSIAASFEGTPEVAEADAQLGGKKAYQVSMKGRSLSKNPGTGVVLRVIARAALHRGRGYIVMLSTTDARYTSAQGAYEGLFAGFKLLEADPTYTLPTPGPSPTGTPGPAAGPSGTPTGTPSATPTGVPSSTPGAPPSPQPAATGTPAAGASPQG